MERACSVLEMRIVVIYVLYKALCSMKTESPEVLYAVYTKDRMTPELSDFRF